MRVRVEPEAYREEFFGTTFCIKLSVGILERYSTLARLLMSSHETLCPAGGCQPIKKFHIGDDRPEQQGQWTTIERPNGNYNYREV